MVTRILFRDGASAESGMLEAGGVEFMREGNKAVVSAEREVILCAGKLPQCGIHDLACLMA